MKEDIKLTIRETEEHLFYLIEFKDKLQYLNQISGKYNLLSQLDKCMIDTRDRVKFLKEELKRCNLKNI